MAFDTSFTIQLAIAAFAVGASGLSTHCSAQGPVPPELAGVACQVALAQPQVQFAPWVLRCSVTSPANVPLKVMGVRALWGVQEGANWGNRRDWRIALAGRTCETCWPVRSHVAELAGGMHRTSFDYLLCDAVAIAWAGHHRAMIRVSVAYGEGAAQVQGGPAGANRTVEIASDWVEFDVAPASQPIKGLMEQSRAAGTVLWRQYLGALAAPFAVPNHMPSQPVPAAARAAAEQLFVRNAAPSEGILPVAGQLGAEFALMALLRAAGDDLLRASGQGEAANGLLVSAAARLAAAAATDAAEARRGLALVMHAKLRVNLGPPAMVQQLTQTVASSANIGTMRKMLWFDREVERFLNL